MLWLIRVYIGGQRYILCMNYERISTKNDCLMRQ